METQLWAIGVKGDSNSAALKSAVQELAQVSTFKVPTNLRVGTLDSLMSLSDDLGKMDILAEATVGKMYKQLVDLRPNDPEPTISGGERFHRKHRESSKQRRRRRAVAARSSPHALARRRGNKQQLWRSAWRLSETRSAR